MKLFKAIALVVGLATSAFAGPYSGSVLSTGTGRQTDNLSGSLNIAASSATSTSYTIQLEGPSGSIRASSATITYGVTAATGVFNTNLGVGTSSPGTTLDVNGGATIRGQETVVSTLTVVGNAFSVGSTALMLNSSGNLGIGVSPAARVDVAGGHVAIDNTMAIQARDSGGSRRNMIRAESDDSLVIGNTSTWGKITFEPGSSAKMAILSGGNVGIGTTSPCSTCTLHVAGTASVTGKIEAGGGYVGSSNNALASSGNIGEISSGTLASAQTPGATASYVAIATITLTAGDWDVTGSCYWDGGATTAATQIVCSISNTNNALEGTMGEMLQTDSRAYGAEQERSMLVGPRQIRLNSTTTYYLIAGISYSTLGGGQWTTQSMIRARRMR